MIYLALKGPENNPAALLASLNSGGHLPPGVLPHHGQQLLPGVHSAMVGGGVGGGTILPDLSHLQGKEGVKSVEELEAKMIRNKQQQQQQQQQQQHARQQQLQMKQQQQQQQTSQGGGDGGDMSAFKKFVSSFFFSFFIYSKKRDLSSLC